MNTTYDASKCDENKCQCLICPKCGAHELHPDGVHVQIRAYKVTTDDGDFSQCLVCKAKGCIHEGWFK